MSATLPRRYGPVAPVRTLTVTTTDAQRLTLRVLREATDPTALPVVFVHALAMNGDMWASVAEALADAMVDLWSGASTSSASASAASGSDALTRASSSSAPGGVMIAMDCRGHGASDAPAGTYTTDRFAQDIADVATALGAERLHLVGCSMGGTVALAFAGLHPERVASLTRVDATACYGPGAPAISDQRAAKAEAEGMAARVEFQCTRWFSPDFIGRKPPRLQQAVEVFCANDVAAYAASCRMLGSADERAALAAFAGPAAVVVGERDQAITPAMAQDMARTRADARLTVIPGASHLTPIEAPEAVAASVAEMLARR